MITHVLDTSALLAHYFDEPGADQVDELWSDTSNHLAVCVLSLVELKTRLTVEVDDPVEIERVFDLYINHLTVNIAVDRSVAEKAISLRESVEVRLPLVDALIAACAQKESAILVHRDPHMADIPEHLVAQIRLSEKG